ncbi:T9SS type A sorting domain-containing protein [candidate division KSB1 bacterium]|nr:T9SS type A sorting domain-containing protein [candidate division KSB1 bacterium]
MSRIINILLLIFVFSTMGSAKEWKNYTKDNSGLAGNSVKAICIDANGIKWFGTNAGLSGFDGVNWMTFTAESSNPGIANNNINDIAFEDSPDGKQLWLATQNGVSLLNVAAPDAISIAAPYRTDNTPLISNSVNAVAVDPGYVRWFGTDNGVSSLNGNTWGAYTEENFWIYANKINTITTGPDSMVYLGTEGDGVNRLKMDPVDGITSASHINWTWSGLFDPEGDKLASDSVYSIYIDVNGYQWYGTDHGVSLHTSFDTLDDWDVYTTQDGLAHNFVQAICKDKEGVMWFGTKAGVSIFDGSNWQTFTQADGLAGNEVFDIETDTDGSIWIGTNAGVSHITDGSSVVLNNFTEPDYRLNIRAYPNPFNMRATIEFTLPRSGQVSISVYNILGQQVRSLLKGHCHPGLNSLYWDGTDNRGITVDSGIYFVTLISSGYQKTIKLVLAK